MDGNRRKLVLDPGNPAEWAPLPAWDPAEPEAAYLATEGSGALDGALGDLADRERRVLRLCYGWDLPDAVVAQNLGLDLGRVEEIRLRALETLRAALDIGPGRSRLSA